MPELAEVEHSRRQWDLGLGKKIIGVCYARPEARIFQGTKIRVVADDLVGQKLIKSEARGKQMLFRFSGDLWLGIHLGMRGELRHERIHPSEYNARKHDYLTLHMEGNVMLVFEDKRLFGRVRSHYGSAPPEWWTKLPPEVSSDEFTKADLAGFLKRRRRTALKTLLLMQERFPGIGNWMADEILWRARLHPNTLSGTLSDQEISELYRNVRWVSRTALRIINDDWTYPQSWLFPHRWEPGGKCPKCRAGLGRTTIGGRTTSWCARCQPAVGSGEVTLRKQECASSRARKAAPQRKAKSSQSVSK